MGLAILFSAIASRAQSVVVTGNLKDLGYNNATSPTSYVQMTLENYGSAIPHVTGGVAVSPNPPSFLPDGTGTISGNIVPNDVIAPANTYYHVCIFYQGVSQYCQNYTINSTPNPWNLNTAAPINPLPAGQKPGNVVIQNPSATQNVVQPAGTNLQVNSANVCLSGGSDPGCASGNIVPPSTNAVQYVSATGNDANTGTAADNAHAKATLSSSYAALPSTGGVIVVSGRLASVAALSFATAQKPVMIECTKGAGLAFSATTGPQITFDWGGESSPALQTVAGGIQGCTLTGAGGTSAAIELGGTNGGADGARIQDNFISGFQSGIQLTTGTVGPFNIVMDHNYFNGETTNIYLGGPGCEDINILGGVVGNATTGLSVTAGCGVRIVGTEFDANTGWAISVGAANNIHIHGLGVHFENPGGATAHYITAAGGQNQTLDFQGSSFSNDTTSASPLDHMISLTGTMAITALSLKDSNIGTCNQNVTSFIDAADNNDVIYLVNTPVTCGTVSQLYPATGPNAITLLPSALTLHPPGFSRSAQYTIDGTGNAQIVNGAHGLSFDLTPLTIDQTIKMPNASGLATLESGGTTIFNLFDVSSLTANRSTVIPDANTVLPQPLVPTSPRASLVTGLESTTGVLDTITQGQCYANSGATVTANYTIKGADYGCILDISGSGITITVPQAGSTGFANNYAIMLNNIGSSNVTVTPTTSTISVNGGSASASYVLGPTSHVYVSSKDNANYEGIASGGNIVAAYSADLGNQSANVATTAMITPSANGFYRVECWETSTDVPTGATIPGCVWQYTDPDSGVQRQVNVAVSASAGAAGVITQGSQVGYLKASTVTNFYTTGYAAGSGTALTYTVHLRLVGPY